MRVTSRFVSVGCNRVVGALDWGDNGLVAYGGSSLVCVYDPQVRRR
jgi:elongator complex protein 2